jgi:hypothetical protein
MADLPGPFEEGATTAFEDELAADARVIGRRTVKTRREHLGVYKTDTCALWAALKGFHKIHGGTSLALLKKGRSTQQIPCLAYGADHRSCGQLVVMPKG